VIGSCETRTIRPYQESGSVAGTEPRSNRGREHLRRLRKNVCVRDKEGSTSRGCGRDEGENEGMADYVC
jgi:hypothetical protein